MSEWVVVLLKIAAMFLVILAGWVARHRNYLTAETTGTLSKFVVDITMPAMIIAQMVSKVDPVSLRASWYLPLLGGAVIILGQLVGLLSMPFFSRKDQRETFVFLVAIANWIYLPLPIAEGLYGDEGVRTIILFNVGAQLVLWTLGIWTLRGGKPDLATLRELVTNPGLIATAVGIGIALFSSNSLQVVVSDSVATTSAVALTGRAIFQAFDLVGSLTIPLSLIVTGAQLGGLNLADHRPSRTLSGAVIARLLLTPLIALLLGWACMRAGVRIPLVPRMMAYIIAAMPVAVSCSIFTDRFGGDTSLAARSIFYSTLVSIATVPAIFALVQHLGI